MARLHSDEARLAAVAAEVQVNTSKVEARLGCEDRPLRDNSTAFVLAATVVASLASTVAAVLVALGMNVHTVGGVVVRTVSLRLVRLGYIAVRMRTPYDLDGSVRRTMSKSRVTLPRRIGGQLEHRHEEKLRIREPR